MGKVTEETVTLQAFLLERYEERMRVLAAAIEQVKKHYQDAADDTLTPDELLEFDDLQTLMREHTQVFALTSVVKLHKRGTAEFSHACEYCTDIGQTIDCTYPCDTLRYLAMPFLGLEGFQDEWAVHPSHFEAKELQEDEAFMEGLQAYLEGRVQPEEGNPGAMLGQSLEEALEGKWTEL
jgi:hypothetical protein